MWSSNENNLYHNDIDNTNADEGIQIFNGRLSYANESSFNTNRVVEDNNTFSCHQEEQEDCFSIHPDDISAACEQLDQFPSPSSSPQDDDTVDIPELQQQQQQQQQAPPIPDSVPSESNFPIPDSVSSVSQHNNYSSSPIPDSVSSFQQQEHYPVIKPNNKNNKNHRLPVLLSVALIVAMHTTVVVFLCHFSITANSSSSSLESLPALAEETPILQQKEKESHIQEEQEAPIQEEVPSSVLLAWDEPIILQEPLLVHSAEEKGLWNVEHEENEEQNATTTTHSHDDHHFRNSSTPLHDMTRAFWNIAGKTHSLYSFMADLERDRKTFVDSEWPWLVFSLMVSLVWWPGRKKDEDNNEKEGCTARSKPTRRRRRQELQDETFETLSTVLMECQGCLARNGRRCSSNKNPTSKFCFGTVIPPSYDPLSIQDLMIILHRLGGRQRYFNKNKRALIAAVMGRYAILLHSLTKTQLQELALAGGAVTLPHRMKKKEMVQCLVECGF